MKIKPRVKKICRARSDWDWCAARCGNPIVYGQHYYYVNSYEKYHLSCLPKEMQFSFILPIDKPINV